MADHGSCFRYCLDYDAATLIPSTADATYQCICDFDSGDVTAAQETTCARGALARYAGHTPGQTTTFQPAPGASHWVRRRQVGDQLRLEKQEKKRVCPKGFKACLVGQSKESWECVDVDTELGEDFVRSSGVGRRMEPLIKQTRAEGA